jgi:hypothetical protein
MGGISAFLRGLKGTAFTQETGNLIFVDTHCVLLSTLVKKRMAILQDRLNLPENERFLKIKFALQLHRPAFKI